MDFKGVAWAGDVYQKFEAMCLEVEEVMYQDTVKYVENQAQKVGVSVKKFYSEVMQDLLPPSCVDPVKVAAGDLSLNPYAHSDLSKKPKSFVLDNPRELKKLKTEDEAISETPPLCSGVLVQNTSSDLCSSKSKKLGVYRRPIGIKRITRLDRPSKVAGPATSLVGLGSSETVSCGGSVSHVKASSDMNLKSSSDSVERYDPEPVNGSSPLSDDKIKSSVTEKLISAGSVRQKKDESECTSVTGKLMSAGSVRQKKDESEGTSVTEKLISAGSVRQKKDESECTSVTGKLISAGSVRQKKDESEGTSVTEKLISAGSVRPKKEESECTSVTEKLVSAGSVRPKKDESECTTSLGTSLNGSLISQTELNNATNASYIESVGKKITSSDEDTTINNDLFFESSPDISSSTCNVESAVKEAVLPYKDNFDMEVIQNEEVAEPRIETFEAFEGSNLEETCVFEAFEVSNLEETCVIVKERDLDFVSLGNRKHKSYKKKICEALSSKLRSTSKEGHKDFGGNNNPKQTVSALSMEPGRKQKSTDEDSLESEWELL